MFKIRFAVLPVKAKWRGHSIAAFGSNTLLCAEFTEFSQTSRGQLLPELFGSTAWHVPPVGCERVAQCQTLMILSWFAYFYSGNIECIGSGTDRNQ